MDRVYFRLVFCNMQVESEPALPVGNSAKLAQFAQRTRSNAAAKKPS